MNEDPARTQNPNTQNPIDQLNQSSDVTPGQENPSDTLVMPDLPAVEAPIKEVSPVASPAQTIEPSEVEPSAPSSDLFGGEFTAQDARQELAKEANEDMSQPVLPPEDNSPENKKITSPIFWLVGIFSFLAIAILVAWLLAK